MIGHELGSSISVACSIVLLIISLCVRSSFQLLDRGLGSDDEVQLVKHLFEDKGYNPLIRPVKNLTDKVTVKFGLAMIQLINVDEKNQIMKSNVWLRMLWTDYQLAWDESEFGGISVIRILPEKTWNDSQLSWEKEEFGGIDVIRILPEMVWKPDIVLFNNADGKYEVSYKPNVVIFSSGEVLWIPPAIYKSSCTIDVEFFPFDKQSCEMKFGSWTFNGEQVTLDWYEGKKSVDLTDYVNSGTWDIIDCPGTKEEEYDKDEKHMKSEIKFTLSIRRKTLFYTVNLIIPCVLISFLSVCVFYLPADAGEKMTMCISILLALVVFLLLVSKILPPTSITIPLIAKYLLFTFIMNIFTILITVVIINWNFRTPRTHRMSKWVRIIFLNYLPRLLFMKRPNHNDRCAAKTFSRIGQAAGSSNVPMPHSTMNSGSPADLHQPPMHHGAQYSRHADFMELSEMQHAPNCKMKASRRHGNDSRLHAHDMDGDGGHLGNSGSYNSDSSSFHMTPETHKAIEAVRFIAAHLKNEDDYAEILEDWRYIAMVIDRLMLYIFLAVTIGGTIGILINAPNIFDYVNQKEIIDNLNQKP